MVWMLKFGIMSSLYAARIYTEQYQTVKRPDETSSTKQLSTLASEGSDVVSNVHDEVIGLNLNLSGYAVTGTFVHETCCSR